jgi:hypothetical protein
VHRAVYQVEEEAVIWDQLVAHITRGLGAVAILLATFWKGDDLMSAEGRKLLTAKLDSAIAAPSRDEAKNVADILRMYFSGRLPPWRFALNVLSFTIVSMLLLMLVYVPLTPQFFTSLTTDPLQRRAVGTQLLFDGFIATCIANYVGFSIFAMRSEHHDFDPVRSLFVDLVVKVLVFIVATAVIYVAYARIHGAFTGSDQAALKAVKPTVLLAAKFQNLTAVYLYSLAISSLPLYIAALAQTMADYPRFSAAIRLAFFWLPFHDRPVRSLAVVLGCFFGLFAMLASMLATAAGRWH